MTPEQKKKRDDLHVRLQMALQGESDWEVILQSISMMLATSAGQFTKDKEAAKKVCVALGQDGIAWVDFLWDDLMTAMVQQGNQQGRA